MIIFDDLSLQTRSDVPNSDWTNGEAKYVVDCNSPLAERILSVPKFEPIEDDNGGLVDIVEIVEAQEE
jgi:hypothetical protein